MVQRQHRFHKARPPGREGVGFSWSSEVWGFFGVCVWFFVFGGFRGDGMGAWWKSIVFFIFSLVLVLVLCLCVRRLLGVSAYFSFSWVSIRSSRKTKEVEVKQENS